MSLGSQLQESLRLFSETLEESSPVKEVVDKDVTTLRRNGVDGVAVLDDTAHEILSRLYAGHVENKPQASDKLVAEKKGADE